ncbi:MAG: ATP-binding cassette domain-containing protein [Planctomycetes bacterium]|nr:ATP-binding cassette domain-containing protein [Planctomycetota bacterium]
MIAVHDLCKRFGTTQALDRVTFQIRAGEVIGFLGPNGAGKTTAMRILTQYLPPDKGRVEVAGFEASTDSMAIRRCIGYLPESAPLYHDLTVRETLGYISAIRDIPRGQRAHRIREIAGLCGLDRVLTKEVGVLSKGYRQRVGLAQALIHNPEILILDEPTTGLDPNQIVEIRKLIREIGREKTVLISTHILPEVQVTCSRVLILHEGRIRADGRPDELAAKLLGDTLYRIRIKGSKEAVEQAMEETSFIGSFQQVEGERSEGLVYRIRGLSSENDMGDALFQWAVERGFTLTENRRETVSLEEVFSRLTHEEPGS